MREIEPIIMTIDQNSFFLISSECELYFINKLPQLRKAMCSLYEFYSNFVKLSPFLHKFSLEILSVFYIMHLFLI
jgi:hypothetical protein